MILSRLNKFRRQNKIQLLTCTLSIILSINVSAQAHDSLGRRLSLTEMSVNYPTDKNYTGHNFIEIYDRLFAPVRDTLTRFFEIGILQGTSHLLWRDYFPKAKIFGLDIRDYSDISAGTGIETYVADQSNRDELQGFINRHGSEFDVILDDGGHAMDHQQVSLGFLFQHVKPGGYFIIEDVHTSLPRYYPGEEFKVNMTMSNTTLFMIEWFMRTSQVRSEYMTPEEVQYLEENIDTIELSFRTTHLHSMICIIKKKG
jgi:SAM-dependent methyltransferase